jgi:hypothetical protein
MGPVQTKADMWIPYCPSQYKVIEANIVQKEEHQGFELKTTAPHKLLPTTEELNHLC